MAAASSVKNRGGVTEVFANAVITMLTWFIPSTAKEESADSQLNALLGRTNRLPASCLLPNIPKNDQKHLVGAPGRSPVVM